MTRGFFSVLKDPEQRPVRIYRSHGLIMGHAVSVCDASHDNDCCSSPDGVICTWDGRLDNRADLLKQGQFNSPNPDFDSDFALEGLSERGHRRFPRPDRDWSAAIWDEPARTVVLASDYAGIRPLYYYRETPAALVFVASDLVRWTGLNELDEDYVATFLTQGHAANRTPYQGIFPVPSGHSVSVFRAIT